ncbi:MAG: hypothetical protein AAGC74_08875 [Verrucomicrobiota bacterium]
MLEAQPKKIRSLALKRVEKLISKSASAHQDILSDWKELLENQSVEAICHLLRSEDEETEDLRLSVPFLRSWID